ncbi:thioredoxin [Xenorhabdus sp. DI]|uniref:thioredoxin n=1 Tax=Xenorhabdus doucetiae TaxID=351671 RepID=UPI0019BA981F|nr:MULTISPECIES: thioredoxin [unclassified Xenorhabdus]MBD2786035.1 thioredoxin [Xenorhabdus sp. 3]MBD2786902.1 thioredoxin [Xenorhabdus sp. DI]MBD2796823.1 thioredoxin [Xenorhabdus sp. 18]
MSTLIELTEDNFDSIISTEGVCVVRFWAPWCGPCRMVAPIFSQLSAEMQKNATFAEINIDEAQEVAMKYGIRSIPTTLVYKNGQPVDSLVGVASLSQFKNLVSSNL